MNAGTVSPELVREAALVAGVCVRPVVSQVTDTETGETRLVPIPCGSTRESNWLYASEWGERVRSRGGRGRAGQVMPPA